ncbi:transposase [Trichocoleus sp. FACHB-69]|uniref:transposase n=1 Tax=Trichocoleus sp. FACHB-69 TaxID=2692874 RepID=UPI0037DD6FCA
MKQRLMSLNDRLMLTKRSIIESIIDRLKNISQIEHSWHRSPVNCFVNILAGGNCLLPSAKETVDRN